ncbi:MAG: hypothetical protein FJ398_24115 [Verrucomicrobia bacterium]|nr:hypothetical protein [Verrucomicrobiota bacterium]
MTGRSKNAFAIGALVALTLGLFGLMSVRSKPDPLYQGQAVSYWIEQFRNPATMGQAYLGSVQK